MQNGNTRSEVVSISVPAMVRLNKYSAHISLNPGRITARQSGDFRSPFKGRGMEFDESRPYQPGDDIRNIDWRVTARTGKTHTKLFREERERPVYLWTDLRAAMFFATRGKFKSVIASHIACLLAWSAAYHGDRVGGLVFSETAHHELKPYRGKTGVLRFINKLVEHPSWQNPCNTQSDRMTFNRQLARLWRITRPGSMIFLISDFRNLNDISENQIIRLSKHNDIVLIYIRDSLEETLPAAGQYRITDGDHYLTIDTSDVGQVERYHNQYRSHLERLVRLSRLNNIRLITCRTNDDPLAVLQSSMPAGKKIPASGARKMYP